MGSRSEAGWSTWDAPLADALRNVWTAWWQAALHAHPSPVSIRDTLGLITVATDSLRPWLDIWTATRTPAAVAHLADLMVDVLFEYESWWSGSSPMCATVSATPVSTTRTSFTTSSS
ncbi:hypothetical protein [Streptomyces sp. NPDC006527]|uniref:hypothetical protein n=1 Tax=Streptomyces sp. NPDC006527 TaxID=3364749 RepID=UPI0036CAB4B0